MNICIVWYKVQSRCSVEQCGNNRYIALRLSVFCLSVFLILGDSVSFR